MRNLRWALSRGVPAALLVLSLSHQAHAGPEDARTLVGNATNEQRDDSLVDFNRWNATGAKGALQRNVNDRVQFSEWTPAMVAAARAQIAAEAARRAGNGDNRLQRLLNTIRTRNVQLADDLHPQEFLEWLRLQPDVSAQLIKPPPNKFRIVDQAAIERMTPAERAALNGRVKYRQVTIRPRIVRYTPIYKTIRVAYPG